MTDLDELHFFTTPPHQCSYLQDQSAVTLFLDPQFQADTELYSQLSQVGFRRSGRYIYKPHCKTCRACLPVR
ncbi:MAG: arginyltransferase, partial [Pseudomonadota bacterium]|nr:arginyltransferase [Pseudomonadota bacterium]